MSANTISILTNANGILSNDNDIQSNSGSITDLSAFVQFYASQTDDKFDDVDSNIEEIHSQISEIDLNLMPVGTIIPWTPVPTKKAREENPELQSEVPPNWAICDGRQITVGPWTGLSTPSLEGYFLRGGTEQDVLEFQDDAVADHHHLDGGHSHADSGHTHVDGGHTHPHPRLDGGYKEQASGSDTYYYHNSDTADDY